MKKFLILSVTVAMIIGLTSCTPAKVETGEKVPDKAPNVDREVLIEDAEIESPIAGGIKQGEAEVNAFKNRDYVPQEVRNEIKRLRSEQASLTDTIKEIIRVFQATRFELDEVMPKVEDIEAPTLEMPDFEYQKKDIDE